MITSLERSVRFGLDSYLNAYVDRRMKYVVEEWISPRGPILRISPSPEALEQEIPRLKAFEHATSHKLAELETRAGKLKRRT